MGACIADCVFAAYIANAESYRDGGLAESAGIWQLFPSTEEDIQETINAIGLSGEDCFGYVVEDYQSPLTNLREALIKLPAHADVGELNRIAEKLRDFTEDEMWRFISALLADKHKGTMLGAVSIAENIDIADKIKKVCIRNKAKF